MEPYFDPIRDQIEALETSIERSFEPDLGHFQNPEAFVDGLGRSLDALEMVIEGTEVHAPEFGLEPTSPPAAGAPPAFSGPVHQTTQPQVLPEDTGRHWASIQPESAAVPFRTRDGLTPPSYRPRAGGGTGIRYQGGWGSVRRCPESGEFVDEEACQDCDKWRDHGAGYEQCLYEWKEESEDQGSAENREE